MESILHTFCSLEEKMGIHSINNHNISASFFLQNFVWILHTIAHLPFQNYERLCFVLWPNSRMRFTRLYHIFSCSLWVGNIWLQYVIWLLAGRAPLYSLVCICSTCDDRCQFLQVMISTKFLIVVLHNLICRAIQVLCRVCFSLVGWCKVLDDAMLVNNAEKGNWCLDMQLKTVW